MSKPKYKVEDKVRVTVGRQESNSMHGFKVPIRRGEAVNENHSDEAVNEEMGRLRAENEAAAIEAISLAKSMFQCLHAEEYKRDGQTWGLCDSTAGIISQINNMVAGLLSDRASLTSQLNEAMEALKEIEGSGNSDWQSDRATAALKGASHD